MAKKQSASKKNFYALYAREDRAAKNKQRKLEKHLKLHPNDAQAQKASGEVGRTRKNPMARLGWTNKQLVLKDKSDPTPLRRHQTQTLAQVVKLAKKLSNLDMYRPRKKTA